MNPTDISPLLRPQDITAPGLYRYRRDSDQPWGFAQVVVKHGGSLEINTIFAEGGSEWTGWHSCADREPGQFAPGPVDPVPSALLPDTHQRLVESLPSESGLWWWWGGDEDSSPIPIHIGFSGGDFSYFAMIGQYGWNHPQPVTEMGGLWCPVIEPLRPDQIPVVTSPHVTVSAEDARLLQKHFLDGSNHTEIDQAIARFLAAVEALPSPE